MSAAQVRVLGQDLAWAETPRQATLERVNVEPGRSARALARWAASRVHDHASRPQPPPPVERSRLDCVLWGLVQPWLGMRVVLGDRELLKSALTPALAVAATCATVGLLGADGDPLQGFQLFYVSFISLSPVPPVLFARHYARIAARVHQRLDLGPGDPYLRSFGQSFWESIAQLLVIAVGLAPLTALLGIIPGVGPWWVVSLGALWTMHWVVVEAFDTARVLRPGETVQAVEAEARQVDRYPWFIRLYHLPAPVPAVLSHPMRWYGGIVYALARHWRRELDLIERHPWVAGGFSLGTALLLTIPGINLLFRPAVVVAATHVRARLDAPNIEAASEAARTSASAETPPQDLGG